MGGLPIQIMGMSGMFVLAALCFQAISAKRVLDVESSSALNVETEAIMENEFKQYDKDQNSQIDFDEFKFNQYDTDGNGLISFDEFKAKHAVQQKIENCPDEDA